MVGIIFSSPVFSIIPGIRQTFVEQVNTFFCLNQVFSMNDGNPGISLLEMLVRLFLENLSTLALVLPRVPRCALLWVGIMEGATHARDRGDLDLSLLCSPPRQGKKGPHKWW